MHRTLLLPLLALPTALFGSVSIDFNDGGELAADFTTPTSGSLSSQTSDSGFNGTGGVSFTSASGDAHGWFYNQSFAGDTASWHLEVLANTSTTSGSLLSLGIASEPSYFAGDIPVSVPSDATASDIVPSFSFFVTTDGSQIKQGTNPLSQNLTSLSANTWYRTRLDATYEGNDDYSVTGSIWEVDAQGNNTSLVLTTSTTVTSADLAADPDAYLYVNVLSDSGAFDDFASDAVTAAVPEPSLFAGLGGLAALGFVIQRRRQRKA
ncbi:MAG: hypothetical protein E1N59_1893 [Puniceicoccaceae bacterium 5H]|nr:MAG: hypothetical protein E1N59_1893 [Puniceicoccaceae bacterium 5H]